MRRLIPIVAVLFGAGAAASFFLSGLPSNSDDPKLFANRIWAERMPQNERDLVLYFVPTEAGSKRGGVIERASRYAFGGELFRWTRDQSKLSLEFPQRQGKATLSVRTWACSEAPKGFELCLELSDGKNKQRLYSRKDWRIPKGEDLPIAVAEIPDLTGVLPEGCPDCAALSWADLAGPPSAEPSAQ